MQETQLVKAGLLKLMHNVLILQDVEIPDIFTPVGIPSPTSDPVKFMSSVMELTRTASLLSANLLSDVADLPSELETYGSETSITLVMSKSPSVGFYVLLTLYFGCRGLA